MSFCHLWGVKDAAGFPPYKLVYGHEMRDAVDAIADQWKEVLNKMLPCISGQFKRSSAYERIN